MSRSILILPALLITAVCHAQDIPLSNDWNIIGMPSSAARVDGEMVELKLEKCAPSTCAAQRIAGPFKAGDLFRFSADIRMADIKDETGKSKLPAYDLNLSPHNVCLAVVQIDKEGRDLSNCGSARLLGTTQTRLELEFPIQQNVETLALRLLATQVTGKIRFANMRLEKIPDAPLQQIPDAQILTNSNGACVWQINGKPQPLAMYFGNNQFNHDDRILEEMEKVVPAGVPAFSFNLHLPSMISNTEQLKVIERFMEKFPDAYFMPRVWLGPGEAYRQSFPDETMQYADGQKSGYVSTYSEHWREFTDHNLRELIKMIRRSPYAKQFIGLKLTYYQTGEWMFWNAHTISSGYTELARKSFIRWLKEKYISLEQLNEAWNSDLNRFDEVAIPSAKERDTGGIGMFRNPEMQQREIDFSLFFNTANANTIIHFGQTVKEASGNRSLVATFYGYLFELACNGRTLQQAGQLGLKMIIDSPYIDIIGAPYSYNSVGRGFGLPVDLHGPYDGLQSHGKLGMLEEDTYTHLALSPDEDARWETQYAPGYGSRTVNMGETIAVLRRNLGVSISHNYLHLWQNLFSEGRFNDQKLWDMYKPYLQWMTQRSTATAPYQPQVAVLVSSKNITLLKNDAEAIIEPWLFQSRYALNRVDTSIGYYLQTDLKKLPDSVRCVILLNPYRISAEQKTVLREKFMRDGKMVVFCLMPNIYDEIGFNPKGSDFCGIDLAFHTKTIDPRSSATGVLVPSISGNTFGEEQPEQLHVAKPHSPYMTVQDPDAMIFARYNATGEASCALKRMNGWTSVFLGASRLPVPLWRKLFKEAGCHLYLENPSTVFENPDFVQANENFLMVQSATGGKKTIRLPKKANTVYCFDSACSKPIATNCSTFEVELEAGIPSFFVLH